MTAPKPGLTLDWLQDGASALHCRAANPSTWRIRILGLPRMDGLQVATRPCRDRHHSVPC